MHKIIVLKNTSVKNAEKSLLKNAIKSVLNKILVLKNEKKVC